MKRYIQKSNSTLPRFAAFILLLLIVAVGCGGSRDDRDEIRSEHGEPDNVQYNEGPFADYEIWTYYNYNESGKDKKFQFQRNRNSCGASENWILIVERDVTPGQGASHSSPGNVPQNPRSSNPIRP